MFQFHRKFLRQRNPFGDVAPSAFEGFARGTLRGLEMKREREQEEAKAERQERLLELKEQAAERESRGLEEFNQTLGQIMGGEEKAQKVQAVKKKQARVGGLKIVSTFADLSSMPKSVRGPQVDTFAAQFEQTTGKKIAPNVIETLKKGSREDLVSIARGVSRMARTDEGFDQNQAVEILTDPGKSATIFTQAGKLAPVIEAEEETARKAGSGPDSQPQTGDLGAGGGRRGVPQGRASEARETPSSADISAPFEEVETINRRLDQLQRLQSVAPNAEARQRAERAEALLTRQKNRGLGKLESEVLGQVDALQDPEQKVEALQQFERRLLEVNAPKAQLDRVRDRRSEIQGEQQGLDLTNEFQRKAFELFGDRVVRNGDFDASQLTPEEVGQINRETGDTDVVAVSNDFEETALGMFPSDRVTDSRGRFDITKLTPSQVDAVNRQMTQRKAEVQAAGERQKRVNELLASKDEQAAKAQTTAQFLRHVEEIPRESFGLTGMLSGLSEVTVGQFFPGASDSIERLVTGGATESDRRRVRIQGRKAMAQAIEAVTGEGSSRISEAERNLTERELPNIDRAFNTKETTKAAFQEIGALQVLAAEKSHILARGKPTFDPTNSVEAANKARDYMRRFGYTKDQAIDLVEDISTLNGVLER